MCEPPTHGPRGEPSSTGASQLKSPGHRSSRTKSLDESSIYRTSAAACNKSNIEPLSPPNSPRSDRYHQPIDMLVDQLRNQSLRQQDSNTELPESTAVLSPKSIADDDLLGYLAGRNNMSMEIDAEQVTWRPSNAGRNRSRTTTDDKSGNIMTMISSGSQCRIHRTPASTPTIAPKSSSPTLFGRDFDLDLGPIQVDEGYCEDNDDYSWLEPWVSLRTASGPGGVTKKYGLRYRTSAEATSNCSNLVHSVPRMRRRDKRRKHSHTLSRVTSFKSCSTR